MPNLLQIQGLRSKYKSQSPISKSEVKLLSESYNRSLYEIKASFQSHSLSTNLVTYFEEQRSANIVMLFIDITNFSEKCKSLTNSQLSIFLDKYYDTVIPRIYGQGGEIEKIIGDGIICIFGEPFLKDSKSDLFKKADQASKDIIMDLKSTDKEVKIAIHDGSIMYYKNKTLNYPEYTMIGKPLTELFRLESVSNNNSINFSSISSYDAMEISKEGVYKMTGNNTHSYWKKSDRIAVALKGVDWSGMKYFECTYKTS